MALLGEPIAQAPIDPDRDVVVRVVAELPVGGSRLITTYRVLGSFEIEVATERIEATPSSQTRSIAGTRSAMMASTATMTRLGMPAHSRRARSDSWVIISPTYQKGRAYAYAKRYQELPGTGTMESCTSA